MSIFAFHLSPERRKKEIMASRNKREAMSPLHGVDKETRGSSSPLSSLPLSNQRSQSESSMEVGKETPESDTNTKTYASVTAFSSGLPSVSTLPSIQVPTVEPFGSLFFF